MSNVFKILAAGALVLTAACTNPDRFAGGSDINNGAAGLNGGLNGAGDISQGALNPTSPEYFNQTVGNRVLFAVDQHTISTEGAAILDGQANWLMANPAYLAVIEGHADEQGTREHNLALGARRSNAVREYLLSKGVADNRMRTLTYGKERPLAACSTESCYSQNRRAVTIISAGGLS
ncbi:peptidoglycan-associated lipoprotein Pal [Algirhabdus cladophorae]|uniref:peptidoglycan-associated lipoprotein Pal n=1 Tax=Algirhabdus cladophorae TaxID=3377108 RepID=UPI003B848F1F